MAEHRAIHIQVVYADDEDAALRGMHATAVMAHGMDIRVNLCGVSI